MTEGSSRPLVQNGGERQSETPAIADDPEPGTPASASMYSKANARRAEATRYLQLRGMELAARGVLESGIWTNPARPSVHPLS